jgi:NADPH-dependent 2,4-dienoyl-CoA reductase/sulfur reductase-like enzyme
MPPDASFDVLVVGAGPAGLAAACSAAEQPGLSVGVVDDNPSAGGQIWRGEAQGAKNPDARRWLERVSAARLTMLSGSQVVDRPAPGRLLLETESGPREIGYQRLILATGARELFLPFPGWTLPNVAGAGGLQALVKGGMPIEGKRVVVAGSGPLLLAVAAALRERGAEVRLVAEQASWGKLMRFGLGLAFTARDKLQQAVGLWGKLSGVRFLTGVWPVAAEGNGRLERVVLTNGRRRWSEPCDYLACGFGLVPNLELPLLLGCASTDGAGGPFVKVDELQRTRVAQVYAVGEITGIGGLEKSLVEGQIAGHAAAGREERAEELFAARDKARQFAASLAQTFALRDELRSLATPETIVCRCEDVPAGKLAAHRDARSAKLQTRCGMGPCQGRICGPAAAFLYGWPRETSVRPPLFPVELGALAGPKTAPPARPSEPSASPGSPR